jgi:hypothetical protein
MIKTGVHDLALAIPALNFIRKELNLLILQDFVFQLNSDFISNLNLNPSGLLSHSYISLGAPPPCIPMPISPQNQTLATTRVPPPLLVPLVAVTSIPKPSLEIKPRVGREKPRT